MADVREGTPAGGTPAISEGLPDDCTAAVVKVVELNKSFNGISVLRDVCIDLMPGEVHALLGVNGSGKSTLIKILAGYHHADSGTIVVNGSTFSFSESQAGRYDAKTLPIAFVHQELGLLSDLTVAENFHIGEIVSAPSGRLIPWRRKRAEAASALRAYGVDVDPDAIVRQLSPLDWARVAIVRAYTYLADLAASRTLLVLDEPTVFLPVKDRQRVWELVRSITDQGGAVLLVSHDLVDVRSVANVVTILRDGQARTKLAVKDCDEQTVVAALLGERTATHGSSLTADAPSYQQRRLDTGGRAGHGSWPVRAPDRVGDVIADSVCGGHVLDASFSVAAGEIVGLTGLPGSGYDELPYILYGYVPGSGRLSIGGQPISIQTLTPARARAAGIALVPADRGGQGAFPALSASENICAPTIGRYRRRWCVSSKSMADQFRRCAAWYGITPVEPTKSFSLFSGGNQQKIVIAKWLLTEPLLLLLHEPTQGVDVASRHDLIDSLRQATQSGLAVLWCSTDHGDLARGCDRVLVFHHGTIATHLNQALTGEAILEAIYG
ncbi:MAG: ATP-binding cassette domain-containing protein [Acidimicrobiales bacterium]